MKKLRFFDSLKFVLATVACVFILNVAHADTPNCASYIDYTSATGTVTQNGTPSLTNPITPQFYTQGKMVLRAVGNVADSYDAETGKITRRVGVVILDGTESWGLINQLTTEQYNVFSSAGLARKMDAKAVNRSPLCTHFIGRINQSAINTAGQMAFNSLEAYSTTVYVSVSKSDFPNASDFKAWVAAQYASGNPVVVYYQLKTPVEEDWPSRQCETIKIATTKYNEESFAPVETRLDAAVAAVDTVVTQTMTQAQAIDTIATSKQTRPDEGCTAKYCLLVEDEDGTPHWYPIAGANGVAHNLPAGYTELQYIESTGTQYIDTGYIPNSNTRWELDNEYTETPPAKHFFNGVYQDVGGYQPARFDIALAETGLILNYGATNNVNSNVSSFINTRYMYVVDAKNNKWAYDDTTGSFPSYSNMATITKSLYLFARNDNSGVDRFAKQKTYSSKIYDDGILVQNLVPAKNSSGVVGMYDLADSNPETAFHTNAGTGEFIAGPDM